MASLGVIGGGLAGLCVAYRCAKAGDDVLVLEASSRWGGQLHTEIAHGFVVEHGAEGFVAQSTALHALASELGLADAIIAQEVRESSAFNGAQLIRLKPGEAGQRLGFQVSPRAFGKGIESMQRGMIQLIDGLLKPLARSARLLTDQSAQTVTSLQSGLRITTQSRTFDVDKVAVAVPALPASQILEQLAGAEATALALAHCTSSVTVSMVYAPNEIDCGSETSGFIVGGDAQAAGFRACSYSSTKLARRSPDARRLVRIFMRPTAAELQVFSDEQWLERAKKLLASAVRISGLPQHSWVHRWQAALPVLDQQHRNRVLALETSLAHQGVVLAGAAFHGAGIDGAVRSANTAAQRLISGC